MVNNYLLKIENNWLMNINNTDRASAIHAVDNRQIYIMNETNTWLKANDVKQLVPLLDDY